MYMNTCCLGLGLKVLTISRAATLAMPAIRVLWKNPANLVACISTL